MVSNDALRVTLTAIATAIGGTLSEGHTQRRIDGTDAYEWIGGLGVYTGPGWTPYPKVTIYPHQSLSDATQLVVKFKIEITWVKSEATDKVYAVCAHVDNSSAFVYLKDHETETEAFCWAVCKCVEQLVNPNPNHEGTSK